MKLTVYVYALANDNGEKSFAVVDDPSSKICIGVRSNDGQRYEQFDSYEAWHVDDWARLRGLKCRSAEVQIEVPEELCE